MKVLRTFIGVIIACLLEWVVIGAISLYVCKKILNVEVDKSFWDLFKEIKSKRED